MDVKIKIYGIEFQWLNVQSFWPFETNDHIVMRYIIQLLTVSIARAVLGVTLKKKVPKRKPFGDNLEETFK